ncbi:sugar ABC transporter ATP-binding protein [Glutamicibacter uratoxydans]|uniref:sugar ABC transporter ATP-binding protein n=1 Tax=Glutamicibacter uratoxydans TaxID=43667 RepID=UPI003D6F8102
MSGAAPIIDDRAAGSGGPPRLALSLRGLSKRFGGTQALDDVSLDVRRGTIHALLGGNGSGKSTTIKILAGVHPADSGDLEVLGQAYSLTGYTSDTARAAGLRFVHQDLALFPELSIAENFGLAHGFPLRTGGAISARDLRDRVAVTLASYDLQFDPRTKVGDLRPSDRTMVAIARVMQHEDSSEAILVLDEPTASLAQAESEYLLSRLRERADAGQTIIIVSHRLKEIISVAHDYTIFRDGKVAGTLVDATPTEHDIVSIMAGGMVSALRPDDAQSHATDQLRLEVHGVRGGPLHDVDLQVKRGEIVGIAGLVGSGRSSLLLDLFGRHRPDSGTMLLDGNPYAPHCIQDAMDAGVGLVPEDRGKEAAFPDRTVSDNISVAVHKNTWRGTWMPRSKEKRIARDYIGKLAIRVSGADARFSSMSGGNQQKVVIARWLQRDPKLLLLDEPTQGVDIMSRAEIYAIIRQAASTGCSVILASSDLSELVALSDRILILRDGRLEESVNATDVDVDSLTKLVMIDPRNRNHEHD